MIIARTVLLILSFMALSSSCHSANALEKFSEVACAKDAAIVCLRDNFDNLYRDNYSLFWEILHNAAKKAAQCDYGEDTSAFLMLAKLEKGNAEFNEFFSQTIEQLCIQKSKCFLDTLLVLDKTTRGAIIYRLRTPLFVEPSEIKRVFLEAKSSEKYNELSDSYLSGRTE